MNLQDKNNKIKRELAILLYLLNTPGVQKVIGYLRYPLNNSLLFVSPFYLSHHFEKYYLNISESDLKVYMSEILKSLDCIHSKGVMHRDVKPQNILFDLDTKKLTIIDFGLAEIYVPGKVYSSKISCLPFKAPELLLESQNYHFAVDIWAVGVIFASIVYLKDI